MRLSSLGDIVLLSPVFKNIKEHWPNAKITLLVKEQFAQALSGHPDIDEIMVFKGFFSTLRDIRAQKFTHLLDMHATLRTILLSALSGIENKKRYNNRKTVTSFCYKCWC